MDTKWNHSIVAAMTLALLSLLVVAFFPRIASASAGNEQNAFEQGFFTDQLHRFSFVLYWELIQEREGVPLSPVEIFLPEEYGYPQQGQEDWPSYEELADNCYRNLTNWRVRLHDNWMGLTYYATLDDDISLSSGGEDLADMAGWQSEMEIDPQTAANYRYIAVIYYDEDGAAHVLALHGAQAQSLETLTRNSMWHNWEQVFSYGESSFRQMELPKNMTVVYAISNHASSALVSDQRFYEMQAFGTSGLNALYRLALLLSAVLAVVFSLLAGKRKRLMDHLPLEGAALLSMLIAALWQGTCRLGVLSQKDRFILLDPLLAATGRAVRPIAYLLAFFCIFLALALLYTAVSSVLQIRYTGLGIYLKERCLCIRLLRWFLNWVFRWATDFSLSDPGNRVAAKVLLVNFIVVSVLCAMWFFGILGLVVYTMVLFHLFRRYLNGLRVHYNQLMEGIGSMAQGRTDAPIAENLGLFEPLGQELRKVQQGFQHAVQSEVRSQNMRTELISNVSHDLKTPLTAIITYVGLLKDETLSPEDRRSYIETLDNKAQRLKVLIEDLFEVSKANSGNLTLDPVLMDLAALIQQVELEIKDEMDASQVEFRHRFPPTPACAMLDGEKTSRIFENLLLNVTKYAMPHTRAYIDMAVGDSLVTVEIKNISHAPLDEDSTNLTERFVRGDRSRGTPGSGLGLAIVKSFVELQGGSFRISTDGDLFKATVDFPLAVIPSEESAPHPDGEGPV